MTVARNRIRLLLLAIAIAASILVVSCSGPLSLEDRIARNCQSADEGKRLFEAYRHRLTKARDWQRVGWTNQVPITKWLACRHKLANHTHIDDCLDHMSYDERAGEKPFSAGIEYCTNQARSKQLR